MGTLEALYWRISGGVVPGGLVRRSCCETAVTSAIAAPIWVFGWKKTLITPTPGIVCDSMCSMSFTEVVNARSEGVTIRASMSVTDVPVSDQMTLTTGMLTSGKMSVGVRRIVTTPSSTINKATMTNVYGRRRASLTIHMATQISFTARARRASVRRATTVTDDRIRNPPARPRIERSAPGQ